jgi:hypothetical protein
MQNPPVRRPAVFLSWSAVMGEMAFEIEALGHG